MRFLIDKICAHEKVGLNEYAFGRSLWRIIRIGLYGLKIFRSTMSRQSEENPHPSVKCTANYGRKGFEFRMVLPLRPMPIAIFYNPIIWTKNSVEYSKVLTHII